MKYPCGINYCGCNMTKISNCEDCYYKSTHQDMGASWNVCTLHKDLSSATIACENSDNCKSKITYKEVNQAIEKQIPKKPYKVKEHKQNDYYCTVCNRYLGSEMELKHDCLKPEYCQHCGTKIDWSNWSNEE